MFSKSFLTFWGKIRLAFCRRSAYSNLGSPEDHCFADNYPLPAHNLSRAQTAHPATGEKSMRNITVSISDQAYRDARVWCAKRDTSVSASSRPFLKTCRESNNRAAFPCPTPLCPARSCPSSRNRICMETKNDALARPPQRLNGEQWAKQFASFQLPLVRKTTPRTARNGPKFTPPGVAPFCLIDLFKEIGAQPETKTALAALFGFLSFPVKL